MSLFHKPSFRKMASDSFLFVVGVVLIWRGTWILLDKLDHWLFGGSHVWTSVLGIIVGVCMVYSVDRDLRGIV